MNIMQIKNNKTLVQMSCTACIVYTFHLTLHNANFGQFKAKQVLYHLYVTFFQLVFCEPCNYMVDHVKTT